MSDIESRIAVLETEIAELRRTVLAGGGDRSLTLSETATAIGRRPDTLRQWIKEGRLRTLYQVDKFMRKGRSGRWTCTAEAAERWRQWLASAPCARKGRTA